MPNQQKTKRILNRYYYAWDNSTNTFEFYQDLVTKDKFRKNHYPGCDENCRRFGGKCYCRYENQSQIAREVNQKKNQKEGK